MKFSYFFLWLALLPIASSAQEYLGGPRSAAMGGAGVAFLDEWSGFQNEALLAFHKKPSAGLAFENRFLLKETGNSLGYFYMPTKKGVFGATISRYGYSLYNQLNAGISYSTTFGEKLGAGMQVNFHRTALGDIYGNRNAFTVNAGMAYRISPDLLLGVHIRNPNRTLLDKNLREPYPTILSAGASYSFSKQLTASGEFSGHSDAKANFSGGLEYKMHEVLWLRAGFSTTPVVSSFGLSILLNKLRFDLSAGWHQALGISPYGGLVYVFE